MKSRRQPFTLKIFDEKRDVYHDYMSSKLINYSPLKKISPSSYITDRQGNEVKIPNIDELRLNKDLIKIIENNPDEDFGVEILKVPKGKKYKVGIKGLGSYEEVLWTEDNFDWNVSKE